MSLIPPGAEGHDFEPSAKDIAGLSQARIFVYNGAGFETWINKLIDNMDTSKTLVVEAAQGIELLAADEHHAHAHEEEGHKDEHDHGHDHDHGHKEEGHKDEHGHEEESHKDEHGHEHGEFDPHVWLDPTLAKHQASNILTALILVDPANKDVYQANFDRFAAELDALDQDYQATVNNAKTKDFVVAHAAYGYLAKRYGLKQIPVSGLSPSDEPSQKELKELIELVKEHNIKYVAYDQLVESKVAQTVQRETGAEAVTLSNLENATKEQFAAGKTYIELMRENLDILKKVLDSQ